MLATRPLLSLLFLCLTLNTLSQERDRVRQGPPVKTIAEIKLLSGNYKIDAVAQLTRSSNTQPTKEVLDLVDEAIESSKELKRQDSYGYLLCGKGILLLQLADTVGAKRLFQQAEASINDLTDVRFISNIQNALAIGYLRAGDPNKAIRINKDIIASLTPIPENDLKRSIAYRNLSNAYLRAGQPEESVQAMEASYKIATTLSNEQLITDTKLTLATTYADAGKEEKAFAILKDMTAAINKLPSAMSGRLYYVLANSYRKTGNIAEAMEYYKKLLTTASQPNRVGALKQLLIHSDRSASKDSIEQYFTTLQEAATPAQRTDHAYFLAMANYYQLHDRPSTALQYLLRAATPRKGSLMGHIPGQIKLAAHYSSINNKEKADAYFTRLSAGSNNLQKDPLLYASYLHALKEHKLRFKSADSLVSILNTELALKDSLQKEKLFTITQDLATRYKVSEKEQQVKLLEQEKALTALKAKEADQRSWILSLSLALLVIIAVASIIFLQTRKKQLQKIHQAELALLQNKHKLELMQTLDKAQEKERRSIADKLHDEVGAMLSVLKLNLSSAKNENSPTERSLRTSLDIVDGLAGEIRNLSHTLMPVVVEKYGVMRGIKDLTQQINTAGKLQTELLITGFEKDDVLTVDMQMHVYRIVQELLNNIIKHSEATNALIQLVEHDQSISLIIEDNGKGIDDVAGTAGNGLHVLRSKIELLQGAIDISSMPGEGTSFIIEIPKNTNVPLIYEADKINVGG